jgi:hypothetical protein
VDQTEITPAEIQRREFIEKIIFSSVEVIRLEDNELLRVTRKLLSDNADERLSISELVRLEKYFVMAMNVIERLLESAKQESKCIFDPEYEIARSFMEVVSEYSYRSARGPRFSFKVDTLQTKLYYHEKHIRCPNKSFSIKAILKRLSN